MYTIINTPTEIVVYQGVYRDYVLNNGSRGCEPLIQCTTKLEVKLSIRNIIKSYNKPIQSPFSCHLSRLDQYKLGMLGKYHTDEEIYKMRLAKLGNKNPNFGGLTDEARQKMSVTRKGKPSNHTGKRHKLESKQKTAKSMKGKRNALGWRWIHNYDCERRVKGPCPVGWRPGRLPGFMRSVQSERWRDK